MKIGVLGAGHLGKIHIKLIKEIPQFELVGFYDSDKNEVSKVENDFQVKAFSSPDDLLNQVDAIDIVTPTVSHYEFAVKAIKQSKHVFIEKPITSSIEEAQNLIKLTNEANVKVQVGHVERFNPAFIAAKSYIENPMFIEIHRLSQFKPRGIEDPVVLDLMIHDIDIVLSIVKSNIKKISASGVSIISNCSDIASARIEFDNGCVANLTTSRISMKNMRKARIFQKNAYISIDFLNKTTEIVRLSNQEDIEAEKAFTFNLGVDKGKIHMNFVKVEVVESNAIKDELKSFYNAISNNLPPCVSIEDGFNAISVAHQIMEKMKLTSNTM